MRNILSMERKPNAIKNYGILVALGSLPCGVNSETGKILSKPRLRALRRAREGEGEGRFVAACKLYLGDAGADI